MLVDLLRSHKLWRFAWRKGWSVVTRVHVKNKHKSEWSNM